MNIDRSRFLSVLTSLFACLVASGVCSAAGIKGDIFDFFREEAEAVRVVTASRLAQSLRWSPAAVYVVTGEEIRQSGAKTLWDALRGVPGVDVMSTRTFYGEVSIRGLNRALGNRTLVLLDGRTVLNGPFDSTYWEGIPVTLEEVDRIEVVEGPASALYGANAVNGVINILTKPPEGMDGGRVAYTVGERNTHLWSLSYGEGGGAVKSRWGGSFRRTDRFDGMGRASRVGMVNGLLEGRIWSAGEWRFSGGYVDHDTGFSMGSPGAGYFEGSAGFLQMDSRCRNTRFRGFWNHGRQNMDGFPIPEAPNARSDVVDLNVEQTVRLFTRNTLVVGGSYRRNAIRSNTYDPGRIRENLWSLFFEDAWQAGGQVRVVVSGRQDWHPLTKGVFSPRGSLVFSPGPRQSFRLSLGKSFRNPTMTESYVVLRQLYGSFHNVPVYVEVLGNQGLKPERLTMLDVSYNGRFGPLKAAVAGFHYRLRNVISVRQEQFGLIFQPTPGVLGSARFSNYEQVNRAGGGEVEAELAAGRRMTLFANYAYLRVMGEPDFQVSGNGGPRHKINGGIQARSRGITASLQAHRVGGTSWGSPNLEDFRAQRKGVKGYLLFNGQVSCAFSGAGRGLEVGLEVFNALNHAHYEVLPLLSAADIGHQGEVIRRRLTGSVSYRF